MFENDQEESEVNLNTEESDPDQVQDIIQQENENLKKENADLKDKLLRSFAENENVKKRLEKKVEEAGKYSISSFAKALVNVLDNLYRASESIPQEEIENNQFVKNISEGIEMTKKEFENVLEKYEVKRIYPNVGSVFDHNFHQAVTHVSSQEHQSGSIVKVLQAGYRVHDRLLRPAMVAIAS